MHGHQGWRLVTCIWLHAGIIHLLANMLSLIFIGVRLEQQFGFGMFSLYQSDFWTSALFIIRRGKLLSFTQTDALSCDLAVRIGVTYLLSGSGGSVLSSLFIRNSISVGASGALFGLLGTMLSELLTNWGLYTNKVGLVELFPVEIYLHVIISSPFFWGTSPCYYDNWHLFTFPGTHLIC